MINLKNIRDLIVVLSLMAIVGKVFAGDSKQRSDIQINKEVSTENKISLEKTKDIYHVQAIILERVSTQLENNTKLISRLVDKMDEKVDK